MSDFTHSAGLMWPASFPGSESVEDPHCTVVYLGDTRKQPFDNPMALLLISQDYLPPPGEIRVTGLEVFGEDKDSSVWVATLDDSFLGPVRSQIKEAIERFDYKDASSFPDYKPHVTLAKHTGENSRPKAPKSVVLGELEAWWGKEHVNW